MFFQISHRLNINVRRWAVQTNTPSAHTNSLLRALRDAGVEITKDSRSLLSTPRNKLVVEKSNGLYYYFGLENQLKDLLESLQDIPTSIKLQVNIDVVFGYLLS